MPGGFTFGVPRGRIWLAALPLGVIAVLAFAPFDAAPVAPIALTLLFLLWRDAAPRRALGMGYLFGLGLMGVGVSWVHVSIASFSDGGPLLAWAITGLLVAGMALFYGLAGWLSAHADGPRWVRLLLIFPAVWVLCEWTRGWFLTGFPWLALGYSQVDAPLGGYAPLLGVYGVSWLLALSAGLAALLLGQGGRVRYAALAGLVLLWLAGWGLRGVDWTAPAGAPFRVSLIQGDVTPSLKWQPERLRPTLDLYRKLTREHWDSRLVIWPETAVPTFAHQVEHSFLDPLADEARRMGTDVLLGVPVRDRESGLYYNALMTLGAQREVYRKHHLVPFGEYLPLRWLLQPLGSVIDFPMSDFSAGDGRRPLLHMAGYGAALSICYEDAFGEEMLGAFPEAAFLVNVSNDAWFGDSLAPHQHLEIARMRALEAGRWMLRSTNSGVSALIDDKGRVRARSPLFERYVLSGEVVPMQGMTPYLRAGNTLVVALALAALAAGLLIGACAASAPGLSVRGSHRRS